MGETRVDLLHLLEDLRDAYPGSLEETILTEIVANALDSGATHIAIRSDPAASLLTIVDNGSGMIRRELSRYHDIAASTKTRGQGIGFAGVGIKLALLACEEVVTETRRGKSHVASRWRLASRHKAPWKWEPPAERVVERGTAVEMRLSNPLSPLLDGGYCAATVARHFAPMLDARFWTLLGEHYREPVRFEVNSAAVESEAEVSAETGTVEVRLPRRRKPSAIGYLRRVAAPLPEDLRGVAISTLGKVIRRGWDWLAITPQDPGRIGGLIEVPALAECLTLNKADFIRSGPRGATFLAYRKAIQEAVGQQLEAWGSARNPEEESQRRAARPLERDLERVLADLSEDFPLVASLVERRPGGQKRLPMGGGSPDGPLAAAAEVLHATPPVPVMAEGAAVLSGEAVATAESAAPASLAEAREQPPSSAALPGTGGPRRPARYGLQIRFERQKESAEISRLVESTVWINTAHPAHERAAASRSEGYHAALSVALALAPLAVDAAREREFVTSFLDRWGRALRNGTGSGVRQRGKKRKG